MPRYVGVEYRFRAHADVAISLAMEETATASATTIAKVTIYCYYQMGENGVTDV
jgi:hypothetical protein